MLELKHLDKSFEQGRVVEGVELSIREGEFFSLLGPSGCGKSTLLRMIAGFEKPDQGEIWIRSRRIDGLPPSRRECNMVFQKYALFPHLTVFDNIAFGPRSKRWPQGELDRSVREALALVQLETFADRLIQTLSGGQAQRVALARALVNRPEVLLLDEPLSALDLKLRQQMQVELLALSRRLGITFVFVTHDQQEAMALSDRIAVMNQGKIEQVGTPQEIYSEPKTRFVAEFIGEHNRWPVSIWKGGGSNLFRGIAIDAVDLWIRPEKVIAHPRASAAHQMREAHPSAEITIFGRVIETLFLGPITRLLVDLDGVPGVAPWLSVQASGQALGVGSEVELRLDRSDLRWIDREHRVHRFADTTR